MPPEWQHRTPVVFCVDSLKLPRITALYPDSTRTKHPAGSIHSKRTVPCIPHPLMSRPKFDIPTLLDYFPITTIPNNQPKEPKMTLFQLIKIALDQLYEQGVSKYGDADALDAHVKSEIHYLNQHYRNLENSRRSPINYRDPATRIAYVHCYVTAHGDYLVQALTNLRYHLGKHLFPNELARVSCIGGGPGSDILAILKYLDEHSEPIRKLTCYLLDGEQAWADTWTEIEDPLGIDLNLKTNFQRLDVTQPDTWTYQTNFLKADLFTLSYFVSEVRAFDSDGAVTSFLNNLLQEAKPGALVLYIDNGYDDLNEYFDGIWADTQFECLLEESNRPWNLRFSEEKTDIQAYINKFDWTPKIGSKLSLRILRKATT